jgi:mediator of RNA polymerase II transcription subunit 24
LQFSLELSEQDQCLEKIATLTRQIIQNQYLMSLLYVAKLEEREVSHFDKCLMSYKKISSYNKLDVVKDFHQIIFTKIDFLTMKELELKTSEPISVCLQPFMCIEVLVHSSVEPSHHVSKLLMIQKLKRYSMARLYCEVLRSCFIMLSHVKEVNYRVWGAFFLFKIPVIFNQLHMQTKVADDKLDTSEDIVKAFEMLLECTPILDLLDTTFQCNSIKCILKELHKQKLINDENAKRIADKREAVFVRLEKFNIPITPPSINDFVKSIDPTLLGLISSLRDPITPDMLKLLCTLLVSNHAYLLYSVAGVKGMHKTMISGILKCNDSCKEVSGEASKNKQVVVFKSNIFDISFILLFSIMQQCGPENFPEMTGDSFFEKWAREGMVDSTKSKSPMSIVRMCDQSKVDELITYFSDSSNQQQHPIAWNEICMNIPAMLYNVISAWENENIPTASVKNILDNMRSKMCCYAVVAATWLCDYMKVLREDEQAKPKFMVQQLMKPLDEGVMTSETFSEKFTLTCEIITKLSTDSRPSTDLVPSKSMTETFNEQWQEICSNRWLSFDVAMSLEQLYKSCGSFWMMKNLIDQIMKCKLIQEMENTMDIVFAVMHLNIEAFTEALLRDILPIMLLNSNQ